jgi:hypothetical protein
MGCFTGRHILIQRLRGSRSEIKVHDVLLDQISGTQPDRSAAVSHRGSLPQPDQAPNGTDGLIFRRDFRLLPPRPIAIRLLRKE